MLKRCKKWSFPLDTTVVPRVSKDTPPGEVVLFGRNSRKSAEKLGFSRLGTSGSRGIVPEVSEMDCWWNSTGFRAQELPLTPPEAKVRSKNLRNPRGSRDFAVVICIGNLHSAGNGGGEGEPPNFFELAWENLWKIKISKIPYNNSTNTYGTSCTPNMVVWGALEPPKRFSVTFFRRFSLESLRIFTISLRNCQESRYEKPEKSTTSP